MKIIETIQRLFKRTPITFDQQCVQLLNKLYQTINSTKLSLSEREQLKADNSSYTYGEILPLSFAGLLEFINPQPHDVFYDLGSGTGKAVLAAALFYDWKKCCGIEFLSTLHQCSENLLTKLYQQLPTSNYFSDKKLNVSFRQQDFLQSDLSDASVIFISATAFDYYLWQSLEAKLQTIPTGTRIITVTKRLNDTHFEKLTERTLLHNWGISTAFIYQKK